MTDATKKPARPRKCPTCGAPPFAKYRPFCSKRCADIDLSRWFNGSYAVPAVEPPEGEELGIPEAGDEDAG